MFSYSLSNCKCWSEDTTQKKISSTIIKTSIHGLEKTLTFQENIQGGDES